MYYVLTSNEGGEPNVYMERLNNKRARIRRGDFLDVVERRIELPFLFEMKVRHNPDGTRQEPRLEAYNKSKELMRKDLVKVLQNSGVDNLQLFPAVISEEGIGKVIEDYVVVNVIGLVECASIEESSAISFADGLYFNNLVINSEATKGLLMFRLAESKMDILIHERVATELESRNFPYLILTPLAEVSD